MIAPPTSRPFKACRAMSDLRLLSRRTRGRTCRKKTDDKWHVAVASAHVGRATASGTARCRRCRGRHVGRGGRVGPCRTCDGVGAGPAVGGGEPTRRTWRSRRPRSDVRRRRRRLRGRRCRANRWDVASASAHVGRATAAEAGQPSDVAAPRVGPRLLLHVRQKSKWRIDTAAHRHLVTLGAHHVSDSPRPGAGGASGRVWPRLASGGPGSSLSVIPPFFND